MKTYFDGTTPLILAHRGFSAAARENTLEAFEAALASGATHLESDIQATSDGIAVLFHDDTLKREFGVDRKVSDLSLAELRALTGEVASVPTLAEALRKFPSARFNFDIKSESAVSPTVAALAADANPGRFLVSSFSHHRRIRALRELADRGISVATSADARTLLALRLCSSLGLVKTFNRVASSIDAVQIPTSIGPLRFDSKTFVARVLNAGLELHFWTINDPTEMIRLVKLGARGIVTDRTDLAFATLRE